MPDRKKNVLPVVFLTVFLDLVGFGLFIPVLLLVARGFGASDSASIVISSVFALGTTLSVATLGRLSDRLGRKKLIMVAIALSACAQLFTGLAESFSVLLFTRFVAGMASGNFAVAQACIADVTTPEERGRSMTLVSIALGLGFSLGPSLGALISLLFPEETFLKLALTACGLNLLNLLVVAFKLPETLRLDQTPGQKMTSWYQDLGLLMKVPSLRLVLLISFAQIFSFLGLECTLPLLLQDFFHLKNLQEQYLAFMFSGVMLVLFSLTLTRPVLRRWGEVRTLNISELCIIVVMLGLVMSAPHRTGLYFFLTFLAAGSAFYSPSLNSLASRLAPQHLQGLTAGSIHTLAALARIIGPAFFGWLYETVNGQRTLMISATLMGIVFLIALFGLQSTHERFRPR